MPTLKEIQEARERRQERIIGSQSGTATAPRDPPSQRTSMMFGMGIVAMAFSYAMLAFRFRNLTSDIGRTGSAEFQAAQHAAETWSGASRAKAKAQAQAKARERMQQGEARRRGGAETRGPIQDLSSMRWAADALQLDHLKGITAQDVKAAYHNQAKKCHPDAGPPTADAEHFKRLRSAYEALMSYLESKGRRAS
jgi:hypothetical protein